MDETDLLDGLARYLAERGLVTYTSGGDLTDDCFLEYMPPEPDEAVVLTVYDDRTEPDSLLPYDEPRVQVRVRGTTEAGASRRRCAAIRSHLHGLGPVILPDGTNLISSISIQAAPASMGVDENQRHEHVCNFRMEIRLPTVHRP